MSEKLQTGEKKSMMHQDSLEPAAIRLTLECLQESAKQAIRIFSHCVFHVFTITISTGTLESDLLSRSTSCGT